MSLQAGDSLFSSEEVNSSCGFHAGTPLHPEVERGMNLTRRKV